MTLPPTVLEPIPTAHLTSADVDKLTHDTRELMLRELVTLTESPMGRNAITPTETPLPQGHGQRYWEEKLANGKSQ